VHDVLIFSDASGASISGNAHIYSVSGQLIELLRVDGGKAKLPELPTGIYVAVLVREAKPTQFFRFVHLQP
jgi:hypothetical protein